MNQITQQPELRYCRNCGQKILGFRNAEGLLKLQCPRCRACSVSRTITRRHEEVQEYAPKGQIINSSISTEGIG